MIPETIKLRVGYKDRSIRFALRAITLEEEAGYTQRFADIVETDKAILAEKEYRIYVDALASWAAESPLLCNGEGHALEDQQNQGGSPSEVTYEIFKTRTNGLERIANSAIGYYRQRLLPTVDFL